MIIVYCKVDSYGRITEVNSNIFISNAIDWLVLDESEEHLDKYVHAQGNYFTDGLTNEDGTHKYIYDPSIAPSWRVATEEELYNERLSFPPQLPTDDGILLDLDYRLTLVENNIREEDFLV